MRRFSLLLYLQLGFNLVTPRTEFPNPQKDWRRCGRPRPSFVCDPGFVLQLGDAEKLDQIASEFRKSTSCPCSQCPDEFGVTLGIFVRSNISNESLSQYGSGRQLAEMLRKRWSLSKCDGDIVLILLTQQNISDFSLGTAVQKILPTFTVQQIIQDCQIHFDSGWFYQGLESIANSLNDVLIRLQRRPTPTFKNLIMGIGLGFGVLFALAVFAIFLLNRQTRKRTKSRCSDVYSSMPAMNNRRKSSFSQEEHLEKLRQLSISDEEEEEEILNQLNQPRHKQSIQFMRMQRQLSDVTEESSEDAEMQRNSLISSLNSSYQSPKRNSVPVTEL